MNVNPPASPAVDSSPAALEPRTRRWRRGLTVSIVAATLSGLVLTGGVASVATGELSPDQGTATSTRPDRNSVEGLTAYLAAVPGDWTAWSELGQMQLEQARAKADPSWFTRAEESFAQSMRLKPRQNFAALAGQAALAGGQHDFVGARRLARAALQVNPLDPGALGTLTDALTELGRYRQALAAARRLDRVRPGVSSFTRLAYQAELRGHIPRALRLLRRASAAAASPAQIAFARYHEGLLAFRQGRIATARRAYRTGVAAAPRDTELLHLSALLAVHDERPAALDRYRELIERRPLPTFAMEFAAMSKGAGRQQEVREVIAKVSELSRTEQELGAAVEPSEVVLEAKYGDPAAAVTIAKQLWSREQGVFAADAFAVALHVAGKHRQALRYSDRSLRLGTKSPSLQQHRNQILRALRR